MKKIIALLAFAAVLATQNTKIISFFTSSENDGLEYIRNEKSISEDYEEDNESSETYAEVNNRKNGIEIPAYLTDRPEEIVRHTGYTVSYNRKTKLPNWVAWQLTKERTEGNVKRSDDFKPDPNVRKGFTADDSDYRRSGYDRGHMCPSADNKYNSKAMTECFYMSNICPQNHSLNAGDWKELEEKSRKWARYYGSLYIVCGPVLTSKSPEKIGESSVVVPDAFYKVIMRYSDDRPVTIGFIYPNSSQNRPLKDYAVSVDEVEELTGIDFFSKLPDHMEKKVEATYDINDWK